MPAPIATTACCSCGSRGASPRPVPELLAAVALRPDDSAVLLRLCALLDELDAHEDAVALFHEASARNPAQAEEFFRWTLRRDERNLEALVNLSHLYLTARRWSDADAQLQRALNIAPDDSRVARMFGIVQAELRAVSRPRRGEPASGDRA